ncbi:hypothetical protein [Streptomyces sp. NPDC048560]|uniref:hypothetical protein n=1 Tax=Streptomyces sp. NPDC048560 TaxID=3155488 RepID=UPI0034220167
MDRLQHSAWQYVAEVLPPPELPMLAAYALADGRDSPALRELAGLTRRCDEAEIRELYALALEESGVALPDEETAGRLALVSLAIGLSDGALSPMDVMHRMGQALAAHTPQETRFLSAAAEYDGWFGPDRLTTWEKALRSAARALADSTDLAPASTIGSRPSD